MRLNCWTVRCVAVLHVMAYAFMGLLQTFFICMEQTVYICETEQRLTLLWQEGTVSNGQPVTTVNLYTSPELQTFSPVWGEASSPRALEEEGTASAGFFLPGSRVLFLACSLIRFLLNHNRNVCAYCMTNAKKTPKSYGVTWDQGPLHVKCFSCTSGVSGILCLKNCSQCCVCLYTFLFVCLFVSG